MSACSMMSRHGLSEYRHVRGILSNLNMVRQIKRYFGLNTKKINMFTEYEYSYFDEEYL